MGLYVATAKVMRCQAEGCSRNVVENGKLFMVPGSSSKAAVANIKLAVDECNKSQASGFSCIMAPETIQVREIESFEFVRAYLSMIDLIGGWGSHEK